MRTMRLLWLSLAALLPVVLCGCGSGSGSGSATRTAHRQVTIAIRWPDANRSAKTRVVNVGTNSILVEVYDGTTRIGVVKYAGGVTTQLLDLPSKSLTFFASSYHAAVAPDYVTDPRNGQIGPTTDAPLGATDEHPLGRAVTTLDVSTLPAATPTVTFTLNNAIAKLDVNPAAPLTVGNTGVAVTSLIRALADDGAAVFVDPAHLIASIASTDALSNARATTTGTAITALASGPVTVTVTDDEVNNQTNHPGTSYNQVPISAALTLNVLPSPTPINLTLNTATGSAFLNSLPRYARSVRYTLTQGSLGAGDALPVADPAAVTSDTTLTSPTVIAVNSALSLPLTRSGRGVTLTAQAYSGTGATGAVLAQGSITVPAASLPAADANENVTLTTNVTGFVLTPPNPTITLQNPGPTTLQLQVAAQVGSGVNSVQVPVNPLVLTLASANTTVATFGPNALVTALTNGTTSLTVADAQNAALNNSLTPTTVTVAVTGGGGVHIN